MAIYQGEVESATKTGAKITAIQADAENVWTREIAVEGGASISVSVAGTFDATVVLQRMLDGANWRSVPNADGTVGWTGPTEQVYDADESCRLRLGIPIGNYVSGTAICRLGRD